jgi:hypothetical protein
MIAIILVQIFLVGLFVLMGLPHKAGFAKFFSWGIALVQMLMAIWFVYIKESGGDITQLMYINTVGVMIITFFFGFYSLFVFSVKLMNLDEKKTIEDDGYTKWAFGK